MQRVSFQATAKAPTVDQNALKRAIDMGQKAIEPLKVEDFSTASLELSNDKVEIRFTIETVPDQPEPAIIDPIDAQALSDDVEGAE